ncbi:hypothetical protein [Pseudomonas coronafaciens]|uniref:hypothetical protein n=1 Tax=Pseudomonas coronafaciens TaxID=53409 RepID=UPI0011C41B0D|nr:hypothetical protein [Pseudomonas coronafaciens]
MLVRPCLLLNDLKKYPKKGKRALNRYWVLNKRALVWGFRKQQKGMEIENFQKQKGIGFESASD